MAGMLSSSLARLCLPFVIVSSVAACASPESEADGATDENFVNAADASDPLRGELLTALKKVNRASLLPKKLILATNTEAVDVPLIHYNLAVDDLRPLQDDAAAIFRRNWTSLKTRGFRIVGKTVNYDGCKFAGSGDYLARQQPTFISKTMAYRNQQDPNDPPYSSAQIAEAKALEATMTHKLTLTQEHLAVYLGKQAGAWKVLAIDEMEYSNYFCDSL